MQHLADTGVSLNRLKHINGVGTNARVRVVEQGVKHSVADLHTSARVWAARDATDWIRDIPNVELLGLGHGEDPTDPSFGARHVSAERAEGHTGYLAPGTDSLSNFAAIALGRYAEVR